MLSNQSSCDQFCEGVQVDGAVLCLLLLVAVELQPGRWGVEKEEGRVFDGGRNHPRG